MRLAQIARKVGMTPTDIRRFLESEFDLNIGKEPNYKLDEAQIDAVLEKYPIPEVVEAPKKPAEKPEEEVVSDLLEDEETIAEMEDVVEEINAADIAEEAAIEPTDIISEADRSADLDEDEKKEEKAENESVAAVTETQEQGEVETEKAVEINYDDPALETEESDFVEAEVDRDAELIQAPKVKLDGLKILGKIELPGDKKEEVEEPVSETELEQDEADAIAELDAAMQSQVQDVKAGKVNQPKAKAVEENVAASETEHSEYKDERGIYHFSLEQKENRKKSLIQREIRLKQEAEKEKKKRHYESLMKARQQKESVKDTKVKEKKTESRKQKREAKEKEAEQPQGLWAKFKRWLND